MAARSGEYRDRAEPVSEGGLGQSGRPTAGSEPARWSGGDRWVRCGGRRGGWQRTPRGEGATSRRHRRVLTGLKDGRRPGHVPPPWYCAEQRTRQGTFPRSCSWVLDGFWTNPNGARGIGGVLLDEAAIHSLLVYTGSLLGNLSREAENRACFRQSNAVPVMQELLKKDDAEVRLAALQVIALVLEESDCDPLGETSKHLSPHEPTAQPAHAPRTDRSPAGLDTRPSLAHRSSPLHSFS
ncbi:unnamed protein product [Lampetra fluviatilis]